MPGLSPATEATIRRVAESFMPDTCVVERPVTVNDSMNNPKQSGTATVYSGKCRLTLSGQWPLEAILAGQAGGGRSVWVNLPVGTEVKATDSITATHHVTGQTIALDVIGPSNEASYSASRQVACRQRE